MVGYLDRIRNLLARCVSLWLYPTDAELPQFSGFAAGLVNDLQSFVLLAGAVALAGFWRQRWLRVAVFIAVLVMVVVFIAELFFWVEFESRLDRLVFHYLAYPKEVLVFLEDQFYLSLVLLPIILLCALVAFALGLPQMDRTGRAVQVSVIVAGAVVMAFGQPVGGSYSRVASEFASNGYLGVLSAARYREDDIPWLTQHAAPHQAVPVALRGSALAMQMRQETARVRHVVLIIEESFAGPTWDDAELRRQYLPNFAALAQESVAFTRVFATGSRTTRGMEALLNGFPPLPGISTTQRGDLHRLPSLARAMGDGGFHPVFLYGGWPDFSNFSNYWRATGFREIWTREDFDERFETSWGVADEALLQRLVSEMDQLTQRHDRVFLSTLTVSHHRPYDFPQGRVGYSPSDRRSEHAMAYADHALGEFFRQVRSKPWFEETLFIVAADHGPHPRGDAMIPATSYRIPMVLHAKDLQARRLDRLGSSMNLPITLLSLLNIRSDEAFSGQDMLCDCDTVVPLEYGYRIGLLERDRLHVVLEDGTPVSWRYDAGGNVLAHGGAELRANAQAQRRVLGAFAPAYQWYYSHVPPQGELADVNHAEIAGQ
jgi:phosphoglycerol transferase MdoB-like AlkP superfamily enzyme